MKMIIIGLAAALLVCVGACVGCYYAYANQVSEMFDKSFYIFFAVLSAALLIAIVLCIILEVSAKKGKAKRALREAERQEQIRQRDESEEQIKREKTASGEFYLTTKEREKIIALSKVNYQTACKTTDCPVCGQPLHRSEGTDYSPYYDDHYFDGKYLVYSNGFKTKFYESGTRTVKRPSIYLSCFNCDYAINYIDGYKVVTTYDGADNSYSHNESETIRNIKWGDKLEPLMRNMEN